MGKGWLWPGGGHSCDLQGFPIQTPSGNPFSGRQLCSSCNQHKRFSQRTAETEPDLCSQLLTLLRNIDVFSGSIRLHQIVIFTKLWFGKALTSSWSSSSLCGFLWACALGQLEAWVRRGKEDINLKRELHWPFLESRNIYWASIHCSVFSVAAGTYMSL